VSSTTTQSSGGLSGLVVRPLFEGDLDRADRIYRTAFGTFLGAPEPEKFFGDVDFVRTRWRADPAAAFGAELDGTLVGSNFLTNWGSVGFFGPLTVQPELWDRGIARRLLEPTMDLFASWKTRHVGLLTFAESPKHVGLYQSFGFWPRYLIAAMSAPVVAPERTVSYTKFSEVASHDRTSATSEVRELTSAVFDGLDVTRELDAVLDQKLGETVGASVISAGVNLGRERAYAALRQGGFRNEYQGVSMHRPNEPAYDRHNCYVIDDWR